MNNFVEQVRKLNEKYGKVLTLEELEVCKENGELKIQKEGAIDEYAFVHITDFEPENDTIESNDSKSKEGHIKRESEFEFFKRKNRREPTEEDIKNNKLSEDGFVTAPTRNKVHLTVNGKVISHGTGNWDIRKYGIIIPARDFIKDNKDEIYSVRPEDSFVRENVKVRNGILLCPQSDYDVMHELNPNALIIPINEENVVNVENGNNIDCVKRLLQLMDIETRECREQGWMKNGEIQKEDEKIFREIIRKEMGRAPMVQDRGSILELEEDIQRCVSKSQSIWSAAKAGLKKGKDFFIKPGDLDSELSLQQIKDSLGRIDGMLVGNGMSNLQIFEQSDKGKEADDKYEGKEYDNRYYKRIKENEQIEEYLGIPVNEIYDGDMITTNVKRIKMIKEKMQEEGNNPVANEVLENCVKHFIRDYKTLSQCYEKRIDMEGFDFEKYSKEIDKSVLELGINLEMMDEKNILLQIKEELKIQEFLKEQGYVENPEVNLANRSLNRLKFLNDVLYKNAVKDYKEGNIEEDEWGRIMPNSENINKAFDTIRLVEKSVTKKIHETENPEEIIEKLKEMGYTFINKGQVDFDVKIEQMIEMAEKQAELEKQQETKDKSNEMDNLKASYVDEGIGQEDLEEEKKRVKRTIDQEQNLNEPTKQGEENYDH